MSFLLLTSFSRFLQGSDYSTPITSVYARSGFLAVGEGAAEGFAKEEAVDYYSINRFVFST